MSDHFDAPSSIRLGPQEKASLAQFIL